MPAPSLRGVIDGAVRMVPASDFGARPASLMESLTASDGLVLTSESRTAGVSGAARLDALTKRTFSPSGESVGGDGEPNLPAS